MQPEDTEDERKLFSNYKKLKEKRGNWFLEGEKGEYQLL